MALSTAKQQLIDQLEARIDAINLSTATDSQVLVAGAMYKMASQVATSQFIDQNSVSIFQNMTPAEFTTWYDDVNNVTALRRLFTDTIFWMELADNATAVGSMLANAKFTDDMMSSQNVYSTMISRTQSDLAVNTIMGSTTIRDLWYGVGPAATSLFAQQRFRSFYAIDPAVVTTIMASSTARIQFIATQQFNSSIDNTTIVQNYIADSTIRSLIFGNSTASNFLCNKATPFTAFMNNATARNEMVVDNITTSMYGIATSYNIFYGNATYYNTLLTSVSAISNWLSYSNNAQKAAAYDNTALMTSWLGNSTFRTSVFGQTFSITHTVTSNSPAAVYGLISTTRYIYVRGAIGGTGTVTVSGVHGASATSQVHPSFTDYYARAGTGASITAYVSGSDLTGYAQFYPWAY